MPHMVGRLGKKPVKLDRRTLQLATYLKPEIPRPPEELDLTAAVTQWGMLANDKWGDCTCAAFAHAVQCWTATDTGVQAEISDEDVLAAYRVLSPNDEGAYCLDALNYMRRYGIGVHKLNAYVQVNPKDHEHVKAAVNMFGSVYLGVNLSTAQQNQNVWDVDTSQRGEPGSWGGHAVNMVGYDPDGFTIVTWGQELKCTWRFMDRYADEAYVLLSDEWTGKDAKSITGFDWNALVDDLADIGKAPFDPDPGGGVDRPFRVVFPAEVGQEIDRLAVRKKMTPEAWITARIRSYLKM